MAKAVEDKAGKAARATGSKLGNAERDILMLGIVFAAIILFVGTGGTVMRQIVHSWLDGGEAPGDALSNAVLLNIALLIFGWRRYRELQSEVAERRRAEELAHQLAATDALTGCLNRRSSTVELDTMLDRAREQGSKVCVFMIDIDNFKQINDMNGHHAGDQVLMALAVRLRGALPAGSLLARIGGDEFACAVSHEGSQLDKMDAFAQTLTEAIAEPILVDRLTLEATVSIGLASTGQSLEIDDVAPDAETLLNRADIAMYHAKKTGRNRHCWFQMQFENEQRFRNELESAIRTGIPAGEFLPHYEQQIDLTSGQLTGFEMLARWNSPRFGLVSPEVFIPVAEEIELISDLSEKLIRQALIDARDWHPSLTLSVNISPIQLRDPWFAQRLLRLLVESGFPSGRLEIEITESCLHENIGAVRTMIVSLRNQGIRVSLDDFGTGYSSLAQLRSLPFDRLKIDRSFVTEMTRDGGNSELVRAIISLGRGLALPVTAEGIEDLDVLAALQDMGTIKGQGFLYGRPEDAATTRERLSGMNLLADPGAPLPEGVQPAVQPLAPAPLSGTAITLAGPSRQTG
ncbi:MAG: EAL domain-containing protein [Alteraurantiacibacter sp.]